MRKLIALFLTLTLGASVLLAGCAPKEDAGGKKDNIDRSSNKPPSGPTGINPTNSKTGEPPKANPGESK